MGKMNKSIMAKVGFSKEVKLVENKTCPFCKHEVDMKSFRDGRSQKEYFISGLCQDCQDEFFGK